MRLAITILFPFLPLAILAYTQIQPMPGLNLPTEPRADLLGTYISWLVKFAMVTTAFLAVIQITVGGVQMLIGGAAETQRSAAKQRIRDAVWGLVLALSAYLILNIIGGQSLVNPNLTIAPTQDFVSVRPTELSAGGTGTSISGSWGGLNLTTNFQIPSANIKPGACIGRCVTDPTVAERLGVLFEETRRLGIDQEWWVTEACPPTVPHRDPCHQTCTCVDIAIKSFSGGTITDFCNKVNSLINAAITAGFSVLNEYASCNGTTFDTTTGGCLHIK
jgi:hypothetical protein